MNIPMIDPNQPTQSEKVQAMYRAGVGQLASQIAQGLTSRLPVSTTETKEGVVVTYMTAEEVVNFSLTVAHGIFEFLSKKD